MKQRAFSAWELAVMENALRYYANNYGQNSEITVRQVRNLADELAGMIPPPDKRLRSIASQREV